MLLADAIKRTLAVSDQIAIYAMVVAAITEIGNNQPGRVSNHLKSFLFGD
jgi:hypothetical protein